MLLRLDSGLMLSDSHNMNTFHVYSGVAMSIRSRLNDYLKMSRNSTSPKLNQGLKHDHCLLPVPEIVTGTAGNQPFPASLGYNITGAGLSNRLRAGIERMTQLLSARHQTAFECSPEPDQPNLIIHVEHDSDLYPQAATDESYSLNISPGRIEVSSATEYGALWALQSLSQMVEIVDGSPVVRQLQINDRPRLSWRGLLIDTSRHFMPFDLMLKLLDAMAMVKLNVLHLHFADDQGFRIESTRFPKLHELASNGEFYTQQQVRQLVEHAANLGIRVLPELNFPGHSSAVQLAYPELSLKGKSPTYLGDFVSDFSSPLDITKEETYEFIDSLTEEMAGLFPDHYFHMGGDEVPGQPWENDPDTKAYMKSRNISDCRSLQAEFTRRYVDILKKYGKRPICWEEALNENLPDDVTVQPWDKGEYSENLLKHPIINNWGYYLDFKRPSWSYYRNELDSIKVGGEKLKAPLLGAEVCMWAEAVVDRTLMMNVWPAAMATAELFWSHESITSKTAISDLYRRMKSVSLSMAAWGIHHRNTRREAMQEMAGSGNTEALDTLARVIEPAGYHHLRQRNKIPCLLYPKWFLPSFHKSNAELFLENLPSESLEAFDFRQRVEAYLSGERKQAESLVNDLTHWHENHEQAVATIRNNPMLASEGVEMVSKKMSEVAGVGLQLLNALEKGQKISRQQMKALKKTLDSCEYDVFYLGQGKETRSFLLGFLKPDPLNRHNIAIQPGVRLLLRALA
ncbi:MAG: family 20 glycosylhydrolase [Endozoicomonas sp.]